MTPDRVTVGSVEIADVIDGVMRAHPSPMFAGIPPELYTAGLGSDLAEDGTFAVKFGGFRVRSSGKTVLVDTGWGAKQSSGPGGLLLDSLDALGVRPEDVDIVVFTHLHVDHVGWNCVERDGSYVPTFPKAEYVIARKEWEYWTDPVIVAEDGGHLVTDVMPLADSPQLRLVDGEAAITPELSLLPTPGHTPGHSSIAIALRRRAGDHPRRRRAPPAAPRAPVDRRARRAAARVPPYEAGAGAALDRRATARVRGALHAR